MPLSSSAAIVLVVASERFFLTRRMLHESKTYTHLGHILTIIELTIYCNLQMSLWYPDRTVKCSHNNDTVLFRCFSDPMKKYSVLTGLV